jgi:uncharacterized membrane protein
MRGTFIGLAGSAAAAAVLTVTASAGQATAKQQRVAITANKGSVYGFVLKPLGSGRVKADSGSVGWCCWSQKFINRDGQSIEVNDPLATFEGKHGTFRIRFRIEWTDAGNDYSVGTGTWHVVDGTGAYKGLKARGRHASLWIGQAPTSFRAEGLVG